MDIVYSFDESFCRHAAVSIVSLFENNINADEIRVFVLANGVSEPSKERFRELAAKYARRSITFIDIKDFESALRLLIGKEFHTGKFTATSLIRIFAPQHLPEDVKRYIYLDSDTAVLSDISGLWETELSGNIAAMTAEPTIYLKVRQNLGLKDDEPYFNSGMLLADREAWEKNGITGKCIDFYRSKGAKLPFSDQDMINYCLKGKIKPVGQQYDFFTNYHYRSYKSLVSESPWYGRITTEDAYEAARKHPAVIHFAGDERPWFKGNHNPYRKEYDRYLALTPWKDAEKLGGREFYMFEYHVLNLITSVCPRIRRIISRRYFDKAYDSEKA